VTNTETKLFVMMTKTKLFTTKTETKTTFFGLCWKLRPYT